MAITDFFDRGWRANPDGVAFIADDDRYTYQEIGLLSCRIAHGLLVSGIAPETSGAVLAPNDPIAWACVLGMWRSGLSWVPLNAANPPDELERMLSSFDCEVLFCHASLMDTVQPILERIDGLRLIVRIGSDGSGPAGTIGLEEFIDGAPATIPDFMPAPDSVAGIMPTGGTTGPAKGVMNTHRGLSVSALHQMAAATYSADEPIVNLVAAPMTHTAGTLTLPVTARGGTVVVMKRPDPLGLLELIEKHRVTEIFLPPTVIYRLLDLPGIEQRDFSSLRYLMYGAAPMAPAKLRQAITVFGPVLFQGYGQTEAPSGIAFLRPEEHFVAGEIAGDDRLSAAGRPAPLVRVEILDPHGTILPAGEIGEVCVRGDLVMKGYYRNPEATAQTLRDGWLHTGDVGYLDAQGYLHITDRLKDMIITGGFNVYPNEVEQVVLQHPAVRDCAVIGIPHSDWGEAVAAFVELNDGTAADEDGIIDFCRKRLSGIKTPKSVLVVDALPRSMNGKLHKPTLREPYWKDRARAI